MWVLLAAISAVFSGLTAILAKCGIKKTDATVATAIRTVIILIFSWITVFLANSQNTIHALSIRAWIFLIFSGCATGISWICYFKALQLGDINKVVPIDKSSTVLSILFAVIVFDEYFSCLTAGAVILIAVGTIMMVQKTAMVKKAVQNKIWLIYAVLSAVFAALTSILAKIGITDIEANLGTAIRTTIVLIVAWGIVFTTKKLEKVQQIPFKEFVFICLSGIATGISWICYFKALQIGPASIVVPIDKLSILITILFSYIVFKEKLSLKAGLGLFFIILGTFLMICAAYFVYI